MCILETLPDTTNISTQLYHVLTITEVSCQKPTSNIYKHFNILTIADC